MSFTPRAEAPPDSTAAYRLDTAHDVPQARVTLTKHTVLVLCSTTNTSLLVVAVHQGIILPSTLAYTHICCRSPYYYFSATRVMLLPCLTPSCIIYPYIFTLLHICILILAFLPYNNYIARAVHIALHTALLHHTCTISSFCMQADPFNFNIL